MTLNAPWRRAAVVGSMVWAAALFVPWFPSTDSRYAEYRVHQAYADHLRLGTDLMHHYGPLGFIGLPFFQPETYRTALGLNLLVFLGSLFWMNQFWKKSTHRPLSPLWLAGLFTLPALSPAREWALIQVWTYVLSAILVTLHFSESDTWSGPAKLVLAATLGMLALIKLNLFMLVAAAFGVITLDDLWHRRFTGTALAGLGVIVLGWFAGGQGAADVRPALRGWLELSSGFRSTCGLWSPSSNILAVMFLISAFSFWRLLGQRWRAQGAKGWLPRAYWAANLYFLFLHGFVRADPQHMISSWLSLATLVLLVGPRLSESFRGAGRRLKVLSLVAALSGAGSLAWAAGGIVPAELLSPLTDKIARAMAFVAVGPQGLRERSDLRRAVLVKGLPTPELMSPVDVPEGDVAIVLEQGFTYRPRISLVSIDAFTPKLARLNREFLESEKGPASVLWQVPPAPLDNNYPTLLDNWSYLSLASHFRLVRAADQRYLIFLRRPVPLVRRHVMLLRWTLPLGEQVSVPQAGLDPVWVKITVRPTLLGRCVAQVFKMVPLEIDVSIGKIRRAYRLLPTMAQDGFMISPDLERPAEVLAFYTTPARLSRWRQPVDTMTVREASCPRLPSFLHFYHPEVDVEFSRVVISDLPSEDSPAPK